MAKSAMNNNPNEVVAHDHSELTPLLLEVCFQLANGPPLEGEALASFRAIFSEDGSEYLDSVDVNLVPAGWAGKHVVIPHPTNRLRSFVAALSARNPNDSEIGKVHG